MAKFHLIGLFAVLCVAHLPDVYGFGRIIGGIESNAEKRPYMASLQYETGIGYFHTCGASIISTKYLLSAAQCNPGTNIVVMYARVGSTFSNRGGQIMKVATFTPHPNYNRATLDYDFAIISFDITQEIILGDYVAVVPLTSDRDPVDGSMLTVSGWGVTDESATSLPFGLGEVDLPVVNQDVCEQTYPNLTSRHMCLGGTPQGSKSTCFGDAGGPAVQNGVQYAVISGGISCSLPNIPGIYGRVSLVRPWITSLTGV